MKHLITIVILAILACFITSSTLARTWTDSQGRTINATFLSVTSTHVNLQLDSGKKVTIPLSKLCDEDQQYIKSGKFLTDMDSPSSDASSDSPPRRVQEVLECSCSVDFSQLPLIDVLEEIKTKYKIDIQLDSQSLTDAYLDPEDLTVDCSYRGISLASAMERFLSDLSLTYVINGNSILITTSEHARDFANKYTTCYPFQIPVVSQAAKKIRQRLNETLSVSFSDLPILEVLQTLREVMKIEILLDYSSLTDAMLDPSDLTISRTFHEASLGDVLESLLKDIGLTYIIQGDYILVTTPKASIRYKRIYDYSEKVIETSSIPNHTYRSGREREMPDDRHDRIVPDIRKRIEYDEPVEQSGVDIRRIDDESDELPGIRINDDSDELPGIRISDDEKERYGYSAPASGFHSGQNGQTIVGDDNADWVAPLDALPNSVVYDILSNNDPGSIIAYEKLMALREEDETRFEPDYSIALLYIFKAKDYNSAKKHWLRCSKCKPEDPGIWANLGTVYLLQKKYTDAYNCYKKAVQFNSKSSVLAHNIGKILYLYGQRKLNMAQRVAENFAKLGAQTTPTAKNAFNPKKGWRFVPCSEGYSKEAEKREFFAMSGYSPYEFPVCLTCSGSGKVDCPNNSCSGGTVGYNARVKRVFPNGDSVYVSERRKKRCDVCNGSGALRCPVCRGTGCEFSRRNEYRTPTRYRYSDPDDSPGYNYSDD